MADRPTPMLPPSPSTETEDAKPWARWRGEPEDAYLAFENYLKSPRPRRVIRPGVGRTQTVYEWVNEWRWFDRVEAYDRWKQSIVDRVVSEALEQDGREIAAEHIHLLRDAREFVTIHLERLLRNAREQEFSDVKISDLTRLMEVVIKGDRLVRGESTENHAKVADLSGLTIEELRAAQALAAKMDGPDPNTRH